MNFDIKDLIEKNEYSQEKASSFNNFRVVDVLYRKATDFTIIKAENDSLLPYSLYCDLIEYFKSFGINNLKLYLKANKQDLPIKDINLYLDEYRKINDSFKSCVPLTDNDGKMITASADFIPETEDGTVPIPAKKANGSAQSAVQKPVVMEIK